MNSKRSHIDSLNAGRQRRPQTSLEELNRTLEALESRFERARAPEHDAVREDDIARRMQRLSEQAARPTTSPGRGVAEAYRPERPAPERSFQGLARDIERTRMQEEGVAAVGKIAGELRDLREELHHQMTTGLRREFDALRADIERAYAEAASGGYGAELGLELERLSGAIRSLAERSDDGSANMLRLEIEQVSNALDQLAREETVRTVERRWDDFDRRWDAFEEHHKTPDPAIEALNARLEQINAAVNNLPDSLFLRSLEEKVRTLATAIDRFSREQARVTPEAFDAIGERLDEISRAIVASSMTAPAPSFNPEPFERIEARITSLARQLEELAGEPPARELVEGLAVLSQRIDEVARRADLPEKTVKKLTQQIAAIADKLDRAPVMPDMDRVLQGLDERFATLSTMLERRQSDAFEEGQSLFRDLERRLDDFAVRLDRRSADAAPAEAAIWDAIDARFTELAARLDTPADREIVRNLEARLEDISSRLDQSARQVPGIDPDLIRNLEAQVAGLSEHLSRPGQPLPELEDIGPRLHHLEQSIAGNRDSILDAARHAAEEAIRSFSGSRSDEAAVSALAEDLKALESLARRSDERNTKTFEAIHDTLLKIVERLGGLESRYSERPNAGPQADAEPAPAAKIAFHDAPSTLADDTPAAALEDASTGAEVELEDDMQRGYARSPAEAAAAAAFAALRGDAGEQADQKRSMLSGLTRAFAARREQDQPVALTSDDPRSNLALAPDVEFEEPLDPAIANQPLEPGSGAPDLNAILKRVRDDRGQAAKPSGSDAAKADFIAAARRAAQAAAAEAEVLKKHADKGSASGKFSLGNLLRARRKPLLVAAAAILIALAGLQLGKAFLAGGDGATDVAPVPLVEQPSSEVPDESVVVDEPVEAASDAADESEAVPDVRVAVPAEEPAPPAQSFSEPQTEAADVAPVPAVPDRTSTADNPPADMPTQPAPAAEAVTEPVRVGPAALREAAADGDAMALFEVAARYAEGRGAPENLAAAAKWYERSAELGFAPAQYRLGNFYEKGLGVTRDVAKAKDWYRKAAEQGNASAMHNLAVLFAMGADGTADNDAAARWFLEAAELGVKDSQFNLGILTAKGVGTPQNLEESYKWFALVAKSGDKDAAAKRDEVANALRPEQLERARATTELWKAKPVDPEANAVEIPDSWRDADDDKTSSIDLKQAVRNIQLILNKNGYDAGSPDGVMGQRTKAAIAAFQKDNGMAATGSVDRKLVQALAERK